MKFRYSRKLKQKKMQRLRKSPILAHVEDVKHGASISVFDARKLMKLRVALLDVNRLLLNFEYL